MTADPRTAIPSIAPDEPRPSRVFSEQSPEQGPHSGWKTWMRRLGALLFVTVCATFGVLLVILPWTPKWTDNPLLLTSPELRQIISSGFVRGLASGLGLLDLWLGFWEAVHYHEVRN